MGELLLKRDRLLFKGVGRGGRSDWPGALSACESKASTFSFSPINFAVSGDFRRTRRGCRILKSWTKSPSLPAGTFVAERSAQLDDLGELMVASSPLSPHRGGDTIETTSTELQGVGHETFLKTPYSSTPTSAGGVELYK